MDDGVVVVTGAEGVASETAFRPIRGETAR
jgi:hypothetical protein